MVKKKNSWKHLEPTLRYDASNINSLSQNDTDQIYLPVKTEKQSQSASLK